MLVYDSGVRQVVETIIDTQQKYRSIAESSINLHADERNFLQIIPVRGVREVKLAIVTP